MDSIKFVEKAMFAESKLPVFKAGDTVTVHYKIKEGDKERVQQYTGVVIQRKGQGSGQSFTVRKISNGVGVERVFPLQSIYIDKIEVNKSGVVRRAKLFYLRELTGKSARIQEKKDLDKNEANTDAAKKEVKEAPKKEAKAAEKKEVKAAS
ncbi:MAG: 50S ribosomal protein L19 [Bacteroidetes bacterium]|nr:50S ribosomal protein L19 [Bacteroidota bacterium]